MNNEKFFSASWVLTSFSYFQLSQL